MSDLETFRSRLQQTLLDAAGEIWESAALDESLRQAVEEYSRSCPVTYETSLVLPGDGREIALNDLTGLLAVFDVWWPYNPAVESWPPNRVRGFHLFWDDTRPVLSLDSLDGGQPRAGEVVRLWYSAAHTIANLDGASVTTLPPAHEALVVTGGAAFAAMARAIDLAEIAGADLYAAGLIGAWAARKMKDFRAGLAEAASANARSGRAFASGWKLDKWDRA